MFPPPRAPLGSDWGSFFHTSDGSGVFIHLSYPLDGELPKSRDWAGTKGTFNQYL